MLNKEKYRSHLEDVRDGDHTSLACIPTDKRDKARLLVKDEGILAGVEVALQIFRFADPTAKIEVFIQDGEKVKYGDVAFIVECNAQALLRAKVCEIVSLPSATLITLSSPAKTPRL